MASSALGSIASFRPWFGHFRSTPISRHSQRPLACPKSARKRHSEWVDLGYSITSSARASSIGHLNPERANDTIPVRS